MSVAGPMLVVCAVLVAAAVQKLRSPSDAAAAGRVLGLPANPVGVRALAVAELASAIAAIVAGGVVPAVVVAAFYAAFAVAVARLLATGHREISCGCFGAASHPVHELHVLLNVGCAGLAVWAASAGAPSMSDLFAHESVPMAALVVASAVAGATALVTAFTRLPLPTAAGLATNTTREVTS